MRSPFEFAKWAIDRPTLGKPDHEGWAYVVPNPVGPELRVIASWGMGGWDHVSVSLPDRCPTWWEMEMVKRVFFKPEETAMQLHVPPADHINCHPHCLHIWRPQNVAIPVPPREMV